MRDHKLSRLFAHWRSKGDADALGEVFDLCAPELSRIALHLVRDPAEADDLVQATFLTAIERSASFDAAESLVPWLVGILVRHAHEARRKRERSPEHERLAERRAAEPHESAEAAELSAELRKALDELPERDRSVLVPFLYEGKRAVDIAAQTGQHAGTVRMQLHRGLERLRKALPAGLSLGLAATIVGGRGLAAVRAEVLRHAALSTPIAAGAGVAATWKFGGIIVTKKLAVAAALALAVGIGLWLRASSAKSEPVAPARPAVALAPVHRGEPAGVALASPEPPAIASEARSEVAGDAAASAANAVLPEGLAGVTGRLVHPNGAPVRDVPVSLIEVRPALLTCSFVEVLDRSYPDLDFEISRARTDAQGRFRLGRAHALGMHGLGIDPGGPLGSLRMLDRALRPGEDLDLGDIVLNPTSLVAGRVVDERGSPIAGARVRAASVSEDALEVVRILAAYRSGSIVIAMDELPMVIELPEWFEAHLDRFPVPTTTTDERGEFELAVPRTSDTMIAALFAARERPNRLLEMPPVASLATVELGDIALDPGLRVAGRVCDASGVPVSGAEVAVGTRPADGPRKGGVIASRAGVTDESGRFTCAGLTPGVEAIVAVRSPSSPRWVVVPALATDAELEVKLPPSSLLRLAVRDASGAPVEKVELALATDSVPSFDKLLPFRKFVRVPATCSEREPGVLELRDLPYGFHVILGRAPGFACASAALVLQEPEARGELIFHAARTLAVEVRDRATKKPVRAAQVSVHDESRGRPMLARASTDANGAARLEGVPRSPDAQLSVIVEHPGYATLSGVELAKDSERVQLELDVGGELLAHVREAAAPPSKPMLLVLQNILGAVYQINVPMLGATDARGDVSMLRISPGEYQYLVMRSTLALEIGALGEFLELRRGRCTIEAGRTTEITIELGGPPAALAEGTARVHGRITLGGVPAEGWLVTAGKGKRATTDAAGNFEFAPLPVFTHSLLVQRRDEFQNWTIVKDVPLSLESGGDEYIELDLALARVRVEVRDAGGRPVSGARVVADADRETSMYMTVETQADGVVSLDAIGSDSIRVEAAHDELGWGAVEVEREGSAEQTIVVTLQPGVSCSGRLLLPESVANGDISDVRLHLRPSEHHAVLLPQPTCDRDSGGWTFQIRGYPAGEYKAYLHAGETPLGPIEVALSKDSREDLVLDFTQ